jgi:hypothetical protein
LAGLDEAAAMAALRRWRHGVSVCLIARDVAGLDSVTETVAACAGLADRCCALALDYAMAVLVARHGQPRSATGELQQLVVFGLGKLGGSELNFSSDIDLVFAYPEAGETDGARPLDNEAFFLRLGQALIRLLGEVTGDGFAYRVDMRLRPFGTVGRLALSFAAMEQYFQREGRDWERYAWIKARPVAGDIEAGERFLRELRPFIYRRYFDYTAYEGLREMKAMIEAEVQRRELAEHLKLGPGGIREVEFIVQLHQLVRGGREPALRARGLQPALAALERAQAGFVALADAQHAAETQVPQMVALAMSGRDAEAVARGSANLAKHIENLQSFGVPVVVAINAFAADTPEEHEAIRQAAAAYGVEAVLSEGWAHGGAGTADLARAVVSASKGPVAPKFTYDLGDPMEEKIRKIATQIYGADGVVFAPAAKASIKRMIEIGLGDLPVCMAKTQKSFTDNEKILGRPTGFDVTVRGLEVSAGAGFVVPLLGDMLRMPGLPEVPAAEHMSIDGTGRIEGLS